MYRLSFFAIAACLVLTACGGGGGGVSASTPPSPPVVITTAKVELDASLPPSLASAITQIVTPAGSAPYGSSVPIPTTSRNGQTLVIAVNANGDILAAATGSSKDFKLSGTSTATALIRLALGDLKSDSAGASIDASITAQPTFAAFVTSVSNAMTRGSSPMDDPIVQQQLVPLLALVSPPASAMAKDSRSLAVVEPRLTLPLPAKLVTDKLGVAPISFPVQLTGSAVGEVFVRNSMPIPWSVSTMGVNGAPLQASPVLIGASSAGTVAGSSSGFSIFVGQNDATKKKIQVDLTVRSIKTALAFLPEATSCSDEALGAAVTSLIASAPAPLTGATFISGIQDFYTPANMVAIGSSCAPAGTLSALLKPIAKLFGVWSKIQATYEAASLAAHSAYAYANWGDTYQYGVCESAASQVISCANEYSLSPSTLYMAPKATASATLTAKDASGTPTFPSGGLIASTSNVATIDPKTYTVTANAVGSVTLTLTDPATNIKADLPVTVVIPQVAPAVATVAPGSSFTLKMTDGQGNLVITPPGTTWSVSGPRASDVQARTLLNSNIATWGVNSNATAGSLTVTANAPDGFPYSDASKSEITISASAAPTTVAVTILAPDGPVNLEDIVSTSTPFYQTNFVDPIGVYFSNSLPPGFNPLNGVFAMQSEFERTVNYQDYTYNNFENGFRVISLTYTGIFKRTYTFAIDQNQLDPTSTVNCVGQVTSCVTGTYVATYEYLAQSPRGIGTGFVKTYTVPGRWRGSIFLTQRDAATTKNSHGETPIPLLAADGRNRE